MRSASRVSSRAVPLVVLLGTFASLRWGELAALRRCDIDLAAGEFLVFRQLTEQLGGGHAFGPPKSAAGKRVVSFPALLNTEVAAHLKAFVAQADDALIFTSPAGAPMRHSNFYRRAWLPAVRSVGVNGVHFHDLRHTGNTLTADAGANLRELMERMGHSSTRAALVYLHSTSERQHAIADAVGTAAKAALGKQLAPGGAKTVTPSGTKVARRRGKATRNVATTRENRS
jgi:integrase